jgi:putative ABC transport system permease protein
MFLNLAEILLLYVPLVIGVALTFCVSKYPDMSVDGTFVLGAAVATVCSRWNIPILSVLVALIAGGAAATATAAIHFRGGINRVLSGIIVLLALYSINLYIIGGANFQFLARPTLFSALGFVTSAERVPALAIAALVPFLGVTYLLCTVIGLRLRASGDNTSGFPELLRYPSLYKCGGMVLGSALVAMSGALIAQSQGFADVNMGFGMLLTTLAWLSIGFVIVSPRTPMLLLLGGVLGMVGFNVLLQVILRTGVSAYAVKLVTACALLTVLRISPQSRRLLDQIF